MQKRPLKPDPMRLVLELGLAVLVCTVAAPAQQRGVASEGHYDVMPAPEPRQQFGYENALGGSPGPGVWYERRDPPRDHSNSATPSRYGLRAPPRVDTAQMPMSPAPGLFGLRTQNVTR
jgi:hypothetical protein